MLTPYRRVLAVPGALAFSLTGLVARLPISMVSLGIVILVSTRSGSYRLAGGVAAGGGRCDGGHHRRGPVPGVREPAGGP